MSVLLARDLRGFLEAGALVLAGLALRAVAKLKIYSNMLKCITERNKCKGYTLYVHLFA